MFSRALVCCLLVSAAFGGETTLSHVNNLGKVNEHLLRGAAPSSDALTELSSAGVKLVIDLREKGPGTELEKYRAEKLGMKYTNVPFPPVSAPTPAQVQMVLNLIAQNESQKVFVHCRRGKDRTGTVVACYRIQHDNWDNSRALSEAKQFGMSSMERGMQTFILHFAPELVKSDSLLPIH